MTSTQHLNRKGESEWLRLKKHIQWAEHFSLGIVFSANSQVAAIFRERLADIFRARVTRLKNLVAETPEQLIEDLLPRLLQPSLYHHGQAAICWLDMSRSRSDEWTKARAYFLARLNEHRETLRANIDRPLVLILPSSERNQIKSLITDLWAIRDFTLDIGNWLSDEGRAPVTEKLQSEPAATGFPSEQDSMYIKEWRRLQEQGKDDRSTLPASTRAIQAFLGAGQLLEAHKASNFALHIARRILERIGETPEALRDISVSLDNVGRTEQALGNWDEARILTREALDIGRQLGSTLPSHKDYKTLASAFESRLLEIDHAEKADPEDTTASAD